MFDDLAKSVASTLSGVFGGTFWYTREGQYALDVEAVVRRDVEVMDEFGQVVSRINTVRIAHNDIAFVPARGDTLRSGCDTWTLGKRQADDGYAYVFEATL